MSSVSTKKTLKIFNIPLQSIQFFFFALFFVFNFVDRDIANVALLASLLFCLFDFRKISLAFKLNARLVTCIFLFSIYILIIGFYHNSPMNELDNYFRFLLLLPLLIISINESQFIRLLIFTAFSAAITAIWTYSFTDTPIIRYQGSSSTILTYSIMCASLFCLCVYYIFYRIHKSYLLALSAIIFLFLFMLTATRGPAVSIILVIFYLLFKLSQCSHKKNNRNILLTLSTIIIISVISIPNELGDRLKNMSSINLNEPLKISNSSLRERIYYINFGVDDIKDNFFFGIGPQNLEKKMARVLKNNKINNIEPKDHLHNEFLDILLKFGISSLILLLLIYYLIVRTGHIKHSVLLNILIIMLLASQLTQSQFAHHQAITFFIALFYLLQSKDNLSR